VTTAFVLTGGVAHGAVQSGMLVALLEAGLVPDLLVGSSVGALNAAFLACDPSPAGSRRLAGLWTQLRRQDLFPLRPGVVLRGLLGRHVYLFEPSGLAVLVRRELPIERLEQTKVMLRVLATDAVTGRPQVLSTGPIAEALLASCAIPGLLPPIVIDGRHLVDGAIGSSAPIDAALEAGATKVIVLPTTAVPRQLPRTAFGMAVRGVDLLVQRSNEVAHDHSSVAHDVVMLPAPEVRRSPYSFAHARELIGVGYDAAMAWLAQQPTREG
jgi:NTE family protein